MTIGPYNSLQIIIWAEITLFKYYYFLIKNRSPCTIHSDSGRRRQQYRTATLASQLSSRAHVKLIEKMMIIIWASVTLYKYYFFSNEKLLTVHNP